jgi:hypothetical protein
MAINYTEKGFALHEAIRAAGHRLENIDGVWVASDEAAVQQIIDEFDPLPAAKLAKWREIQVERDRRKDAGYVTAGRRFHSDASSRIQQLGLVIMGASVPPTPWKTLDVDANGAPIFVTLTPALAQGIFATTATADMQVFGAAEAHRAAVYALTTLAEVQAYDFSGGWPAV